MRLLERQSLPDEMAARVFESSLERDRRFADRLFAVLMGVQWLAGIVAALIIAPRTWIGTTSQLHVHVWAAVVVGALIAALPVSLALWLPGRVLTRHVIAIGQILFSCLLIHLSGGRIETHFHVFGSLAFLAFYRDPWVLVTATGVVAVDHLLRGIYFPESVFGILTPSSWRWLEHTAWVSFEAVVLWVSIRRGLQELQQIASQQSRLDSARLTAEDANRAKSVFLANVSHEIRTPMTAILGFAGILTEENSREVRLDAARTILRNGEYLLQLLSDLLDLSKIEAGKLDVERIPCSPRGIVEDVRALMEPRAAEKQLAFEVEYTPQLPDAILSDPMRLRQILLNLIGNAIKFTVAGSVRLSVQLDASGAGSTIVFSVRDTGIGMTSDQVARLFRPFTQAESSTTRNYGGTGLGLSISKRLSELLGGEIEVESEPGVGSTFRIRIQAGNLPSLPPDDVPVALDAPARSTRAPSDLQGIRILLAEDGPDNQRLMCAILRGAGAEVVVAQDGALAVELALRGRDDGEPYSVILMDMSMPRLDGYAATRALRGRSYTHPIIALTAYAMPEEREKCLRAGCDDFATKPIDRASLLALISRWAQKPA